jgi:hypothetical protein
VHHVLIILSRNLPSLDGLEDAASRMTRNPEMVERGMDMVEKKVCDAFYQFLTSCCTNLRL